MTGYELSKLSSKLKLNRQTLIVVGAIASALGIISGGEMAAVAFAGGLILAWTLKPAKVVDRQYHYEDKKVRVYDDEEPQALKKKEEASS